MEPKRKHVRVQLDLSRDTEHKKLDKLVKATGHTKTRVLRDGLNFLHEYALNVSQGYELMYVKRDDPDDRIRVVLLAYDNLKI